MCFNFKNRICEYPNINVFKHEESVKVSVDNAHTHGACGGDLMDSPIADVLHSSAIDVEYVFVSSNTVTIFEIILINVYHISN